MQCVAKRPVVTAHALRRTAISDVLGHQRVEPIPAELYLALTRGYISLLTTNIMYAAGIKAAAGDIERGAPLNVVQAFAGHNQIASLDPYIRMRPAEDLRTAVEGRSYLAPG